MWLDYSAFDGFHAALKRQGSAGGGRIHGDQQFFIAFAQNYEGKSREGALRQQY